MFSYESKRFCNPDLICLDFMMPVLDGSATLIEILASAAFRRIPVVVMSVISKARVAERCSGCSCFMPKSFKVAQLKIVVGQLLGKSADPLN